MKKLLQISTVLVAAFFYGQQVSDYQYIYVPETFSNVKANKHGLNELLTLKLKQKKFIIIKESVENWPAELAGNPCQVLTAELSDTSSMFKNKVNIDFKDCENKSILSLDGKSLIKEFEPGMRDALEDAAKKIPLSVTVERPYAKKTEELTKEIHTTKIANTEVAVVPKKNTKQVVPAPKIQATAEIKAEVYSNGSLTLNRIFLANGEFILVNPNNSVPYATFKPSGKKDVYRVQLENGTSTIGYLEDGKIEVELVNADGSFRTEVFSKK